MSDQPQQEPTDKEKQSENPQNNAQENPNPIPEEQKLEKKSILDFIKPEQIINYSALPFENESSSVTVAVSDSKDLKQLVKTQR